QYVLVNFNRLLVFLGFLTCCGCRHNSPPEESQAQYVDSRLCIQCHSKVYETYSRTGMARSFYRPRPENTVEDYTRKNIYYHKPSDSYFTMLRRDGKYYQVRHQMGAGGKPTNIEEKEISFVMGSGNHVRTYLNRNSRGILVELPLGWYAENGG